MGIGMGVGDRPKMVNTDQLHQTWMLPKLIQNIQDTADSWHTYGCQGITMKSSNILQARLFGLS